MHTSFCLEILVNGTGAQYIVFETVSGRLIMQQFCCICHYSWGDAKIIVGQQESLGLLYSKAVADPTEQQPVVK